MELNLKGIVIDKGKPLNSSKLKPEEILKIRSLSEFGVKEGTKEVLLAKGLITEAYKDCVFSEDRVRANAERIHRELIGSSKEIQGLDEYLRVTQGILTRIRDGFPLEGSYLIGAPNSFGKTTFVNSAISMLYLQGKRVVPYVSLYELAELKYATDSRLIGSYTLDIKEGFSNDAEDYMRIEKKPVYVSNGYSWSEYMNADVLFCYLSSPTSKLIESQLLAQILMIRGVRCLPTVVLTSSSVDLYTEEPGLKNLYWDEILLFDKRKLYYDRLHYTRVFFWNKAKKGRKG